MELWKNLPGHDNYLVSSHGRIKRIDDGKIHTGSINNKGYVRFDLCENGKRFVIAGHRAVAQAFLPQVNGKTLINHKDGNKCNNHVDNLEWCTQRENSIHAYHVLNVKPSKMISVMCVETGDIYESMLEAERKTGISNVLIHNCISGKRKSTHGLHWKRAEVAQRQ